MSNLGFSAILTSHQRRPPPPTWDMSLSFCQASGIMSMTDWAMSRPVRTSSSSTPSKLPESLWLGGTMGSSCSGRKRREGGEKGGENRLDEK